MRTILLSILIFLSCRTLANSQEWLADSLISKLETAKPGFDQIDYSLGIARSYILIRNREKILEYLEKSWALSEKYNDLSGKAQVKSLYQIYARGYLNDTNLAVQYGKEAYDFAIESGDRDAITFALYQYAEAISNYQQKVGEAMALIKGHLNELDHTVTLKNKANLYKTLANLTAKQGNDSLAIAYFRIALDLIEERITNPDNHHRLDRVSALYADKGIINKVITSTEFALALNRTGKIKQAMSIIQENIEITQAINNTDYEAWQLKTLGELYRNMGESENALINYQKALVIWEKDPTTLRDVAIVRERMAQIYLEMGDYETAINNFKLVRKYSITKKDTSSSIVATHGLIKSYIEKGEVKRGYQMTEKLLEIASAFGSENLLVETKYLKAYSLLKQGQYEEALFGFENVYSVSNRIGNKLILPDVLNQMALCHKGLGSYNEAIKNLNKSIELCQSSGQKNFLSSSYNLLSGVYAAQSDYKSALDGYILYHTTEGDLLAENSQKILKEEQVRQNVNKYKAEKEASAERAVLLQTQNRLFIGLAATLFTFLLVGSYLYKELRNSQLLIEKSNRQLADLNATKDKFFGIIAHDIRSPLVALSGVGEQMDYYVEKGKTEKMKQLSNKIGNTANHLSSLLDNLLNWALLQRGMIPHKPQNVSLQSLVAENVNMFNLNAESKNITIVNLIAPEVMVTADQLSLNTIVRNLLSNALKFTPKGGQVVIECELTDHHVSLRFKDNGIGMDADKADQIFNLNPNREEGTEGEKGTGLGLILCKELIELNNGKISVESTKDEGTTFLVNLPVAA